LQFSLQAVSAETFRCTLVCSYYLFRLVEEKCIMNNQETKQASRNTLMERVSSGGLLGYDTAY
jgi:hypothetical protein